MPVPVRKVIVVGGGIGGLCTAIALHRSGVDVTIYEQAPELRAVGAGLTIWPNAVKGFRRLGVAERVISAAARIRLGELRDSVGRVLTVSDPKQLEAKVGEPTIAIHRARLHEVLLSALPDGMLHPGKECIEIVQASDDVNIKFRDGSSVTADFVVGADGINSAVRQCLFPEVRPRYAGYCAWRGVVETKDLAALGTTSEGWGCGARFGVVRVDEKRVYWFATSNADEGSKQTAAERKTFLLNRFRGWYSPIEELIASTPDEALLHNDICDLVPLKSWTKGRVVLLGDAAHATTPNLGQGACMAVESSVILANCLKQEDELGAALARFERIRMPRTKWITETSWRIGRVGQWENRFACRMRNIAVKLSPNRFAAGVFEKASTIEF